MKEEFKGKVLQAVDQILGDLGGDLLFMVVKPVVNLAKPELERMLEEKPEDVYKWLVTAQEKISEAIKTFEVSK